MTKSDGENEQINKYRKIVQIELVVLKLWAIKNVAALFRVILYVKISRLGNRAVKIYQ